MTLRKQHWFAIGLNSSKFCIEVREFFNGNPYSGKKLEEMTGFLESCERGEELMDGKMKRSHENFKKLKLKDLYYYHIFRQISKNKKVDYYLTHISKLKKGDKSSAKILRNFSDRLFNLASMNINYSDNYGFKFAA
jgi:hypothetical protein